MAVANPTVGTKDERAAASTTSTPAFPTVTAGDLLLGLGVSGASSTTTFSTTATGFSQDAQDSNTGDTLAPNCFISHKIASGSESGTQSWPHGNVVTSMCIVGVSGVDTTTPFDPNVNGGAPTLIDISTASSSISIPSVTVTQNGSMLVYVISGNATSNTATPPAGWTEIVDRTLASSRNWQVCYKAVNSGATGTATGSWTGSQRATGYLLVLQPAGGATNVNLDVTVGLVDTITSAAQVGVATGATVPLTDTVTSTAQVGVVAGAAIALTATIAASLVVGTSSGASVNETTTIASTAQVGVSSGSSIPLTAAISSTLSVGGSAVSIGSTVPLADTIASTAVVGVSSGAALTETTAITSAAQVGKQTGASLSETVAVTSTAQVGKAAGATIAPVFAVTSSGVVGVQSGASVGVTFAVTAAISVQSGGPTTPYIELFAPPRTGTLAAPERDTVTAPPVTRTLTAPDRDALVAPPVRRTLTAPEV